MKIHAFVEWAAGEGSAFARGARPVASVLPRRLSPLRLVVPSWSAAGEGDAVGWRDYETQLELSGDPGLPSV